MDLVYGIFISIVLVLLCTFHIFYGQVDKYFDWYMVMYVSVARRSSSYEIKVVQLLVPFYDSCLAVAK